MKDSVSLLRVAATLVIVFSHSLGFYGAWPTRFTDYVLIGFEPERELLCETALNTFVLLSGYLYAKIYIEKSQYRNTTSFLKKKAKRLMLPFFAWALIIYVLFSETESIKTLLEGCQHLWFLPMLFGCFVLIRLYDFDNSNFKRSTLLICVTITLCTIISYISSSVPNILAWKQTLTYFPGFLLGVFYYCFDNNYRKSIGGGKLIVILLIFIFLSIAVNICYTPPYRSLYRSIPTYIAIMAVFRLLDEHYVKTNTIIKSLDKCSLGIYILHHIYIFVILTYVPSSHIFMRSEILLGSIAMFISSLFISWGLSFVMLRNKTTRIFLGC